MFDVKRIPGFAVCLTLTALLAACGGAPPNTPIPAPATLAEQNLPPSAASEVVLPTATLAAITAAPEPSPTPLNPLAIEAMRARLSRQRHYH